MCHLIPYYALPTVKPDEVISASLPPGSTEPCKKEIDPPHTRHFLNIMVLDTAGHSGRYKTVLRRSVFWVREPG